MREDIRQLRALARSMSLREDAEQLQQLVDAMERDADRLEAELDRIEGKAGSGQHSAE
jgi:hypothetical protein